MPSVSPEPYASTNEEAAEMASNARAEAARRAAIASRVAPPATSSAPYAKPGNVRAVYHHCPRCGDVMVPSFVAMWRRETRTSLGVPPCCWDCAEKGR